MLSNVAQGEIRNVVSDGNGKVATNGIYIETTQGGSFSASILGCRVFGSGSGLRIACTSGTVQEIVINDNVIHDNDAGIYCTGSSLASIFIGSANVFRANTTSGNTVGWSSWPVKTSNYSLDVGDSGVFLGGTTGTLTLQPAASRTRPVVLRSIASGNWTISSAGSDTIEGAASITLTPGSARMLMPNGANWLVVS